MKRHIDSEYCLEHWNCVWTVSNWTCGSLTVNSIICSSDRQHILLLRFQWSEAGDNGKWEFAELSLVRLSLHLSCIHSSFDFFTECEQRVAKLGVLGKIYFENHCKQCKYIYTTTYIYNYLAPCQSFGRLELAVRVDNDMHCFSEPRYTHYL